MPHRKIVDQLFYRLSQVALEALQAAVQLSKQRGFKSVELEHWLYCIMQSQDSDLHRVIKHFGLSDAMIEEELGGFRRRSMGGYEAPPGISPRVRECLSEAWIQASVGSGEDRIRSGHLLLAALNHEDLHDLLRNASASLAALRPDAISEQFSTITNGSPEAVGGDAVPASPTSVPAVASPASPVPTRPEGALSRFTEDLTARAREGRIDPVDGRNREIDQVIRILSKRRFSNPILTGEAGVGKTAVVEGLALKIASGDIIPALKDASIRALDLTRLQAGAGVRGEFENRLKALLDEVKTGGNIILFIDEAHTLIGAGGTAGQGDAANLLKPALARGELRTIAATTADEYRKHIEEDPALRRRFEEVPIGEPDEATAIEMLRGLAPKLGAHHGPIVLEEAMDAAVRMSVRYLPARRLPEKAVALLDTACTVVALAQLSVPAPIRDTRGQVAALKSEIESLEKESIIGHDHSERLGKLRKSLEASSARLASLEAQHQRELPLVQEIISLRNRLLPREKALPAAEVASEFKAALSKAEKQLAVIQQDAPLVHATVNRHVVATVIEEATGIPAGRMARDEIQAVLNLAQALRKRVVGQDAALGVIEAGVRNAEARLNDPNRPIGAFLLVGPSGVGKTETALALAEARYGSERNLIVFNMNEFREEYGVSVLLGSVPGTVQSDKGGQLSEAVRRRPYSVILLDEFEKAHKGIQEVFLQVLDQGWTKDRQGRFIDFRNCILLFTSNAGSEHIMDWCEDPKTKPEPDVMARELKTKLLGQLSAPLLGRLSLVPYFPLETQTLEGVVRIKLQKIQNRLREHHGAELICDPSFTKHVLESCTEAATGARLIDSFITTHLVSELSRFTLSALLEKRRIKEIRVGVENDSIVIQSD